MFIVLLGAPGSGKGTVGKIIAKNLNLAHVSTGAMFREQMKNETEIGKKIHRFMNNGELVPDEITVEMLIERLKKEDVSNGAILDGFPRTLAQAVKLDEILANINEKVDMALNIDVPFDEIIKRIAKRRNCKKCNEIYNLEFNPPKIEGLCDKCGGELYQREDQKPDVVKNRLQIYSQTAKDIIDYYEKAKVLVTKQAGDKIGKTSYDVAEEIEQMFNK